MSLNIVVTGATGMVGGGVLLFCLEDPNIASVLSVSRIPSGIAHPKLKEIIQNDFRHISENLNALAGYDACYFCLGVSSAGMNETDYTETTYKLTLDFAEVFKAANPKSVFCYISGEGTDSSEKGRVMWARIKGKTENELLNMEFKDAFMFRPGFIKALRGSKSKTKFYAAIYFIFKPFFPLLMLSKKIATDTDRIAKAMIDVTLNGSSMKVLNTLEINRIACRIK